MEQNSPKNGNREEGQEIPSESHKIRKSYRTKRSISYTGYGKLVSKKKMTKKAARELSQKRWNFQPAQGVLAETMDEGI